MPIVIVERHTGRRADGENAERQYLVSGTDDAYTALVNGLAASPVTYAGLVRHSRASGAEPVSEGVEQAWLVTVRYSRNVPASTDKPRIRRTSTGGTAHISWARATTAYPGSASDNDGAINATPAGVGGVDIVVPLRKRSETWVFSRGSGTDDWLDAVESMTGTYNSDAWRGYEARQVLFEGIDCNDDRNSSEIEVTFNFAIGENESDLAVGDLTGIEKRAWDYLEVEFIESVESSQPRKKVQAVRVHRVYRGGNFGIFGIDELP